MTTVLESSVAKDDAFRRREAHWAEALERLRQEEAALRLGGGEKALAKQRTACTPSGAARRRPVW